MRLYPAFAYYFKTNDVCGCSQTDNDSDIIRKLSTIHISGRVYFKGRKVVDIPLLDGQCPPSTPTPAIMSLTASPFFYGSKLRSGVLVKDPVTSQYWYGTTQIIFSSAGIDDVWKPMRVFILAKWFIAGGAKPTYNSPDPSKVDLQSDTR